MRAIGILGIIILTIMCVGYVGTWITAGGSHDANSSGVPIRIDPEQLEADREEAIDRIGILCLDSKAAVKAMARETGSGESMLEGRLSAIHAVSRELVVDAGSQAIALYIEDAVPILRDGASIGFDQMAADTKARFVFAHAGEERRLARIEILR